MKQITTTEAAQLFTPEALAFIKKLLAAGFRVSTSHYEGQRPQSKNYFNAQNAYGVCYIQQNTSHDSFQFTTCHKPNRETGTGYQITDGADATTENAAGACKMIIPQGFKRRQEEPHKTLEEKHSQFIEWAVEIVRTPAPAQPLTPFNDCK